MLKVVVLSISMILTSVVSINGILPEIRDSLGITQTQSEILVTLPSIAVLASVLLSNFLVGKIGMKKTVALGLIIAGIGGITPVFLYQNYMQLLISRLIFGIGTGLFATLSVSYINLLFDEEERATLIGYRGSVELLGQSAIAMLVGFLFRFGWNMSFLAYGISFFLVIFFYFKVPDVERESEESDDNVKSEKMNILVYPIILFSFIIVLCGSAIAVRFSAMVTEIQGESYNSSWIIAIKPIFSIIGGILFGKLNKLLGKKLLYLAIFLFSISAFMIGFSNGSFVILIVGFLLSGVVPAWIFPFTFNMISKITQGKKQQIAMSLAMAGANVGIFMMPFVIQFLEMLLGDETLTAPYPILGYLLVGVLVVVMVLGNKISQKIVEQN